MATRVSKKDKVTTKRERETLLTSHQSINMLSRTLGIKESAIKAWLAKNRPNYQQEFESHQHTDSRVVAALEKKLLTVEEEKKKLEEEIRAKVLAELQEKQDEDLKKAIELEKQNQNNSAMEDLMEHKEKDSKGNRRFVTIMTEPASMRGDEYRKVIKKNNLDQPHIHRPKRK